MLLETIGFLNFILFALAPVVFCALYFNCRPEKSFLPLLLTNSMLFYFMAILHVTQYGFYCLYAVNLALYVPSAMKYKKLPRIERNEKLFTPGFFIMLIFTAVMFIFFCDSKFISWDPISHWGKVVKLFMAEGKLGCEYPLEIVSHASYPPGSCMTSVMIHACFFGVPFREGIVIFAHEIINLGAFLWLFCALNWQNKVQMLKFTALLLLLPILYLIACYDPCYTDTLLALLMAVCVYQTVKPGDYKPLDIFMLAVMSSWMFMIRNAGWGYSVGLMILMVFNLIRDRRKAFTDPVSGKLSYLKSGMMALFFLLPVFMKYLWVFLMKYYQTGQKFGGKNINLAAIKEQFGSFEAPGWIISKLYLFSNTGNLIFIAILIFTAVRMYRKSQDPAMMRAIKSSFIFFLIATPAFFITMLIYYIFEFNELRQFPSLPRYSSNFLLIPSFVLLLFAADNCAGRPGYVFRKKVCFDDSTISNCKFLLTGAWIFTIGILLTSVQMSYNAAFYTTTRLECERSLKYSDIITADDCKFTVLTTEGNGIRNFYMSYLYADNFRQIKAWDPILPGSPVNKTRLYALEAAPDELMQQWKNCQYVYIDRIKPDFVISYPQVFAGGFTPTVSNVNHRLFKVMPDLRLQPVD